MDKVKQESQQIKEKLNKDKEAKLKMHEKKHSYAKYVKEIHWPDVSTKKQEELEMMKQ